MNWKNSVVKSRFVDYKYPLNIYNTKSFTDTCFLFIINYFKLLSCDQKSN